MSERPILFSAPMVRAILAGTKTQTRRVIKPQPIEGESLEIGIYAPTVVDRYGEEGPGPEGWGASNEYECIPSPYGKPGDRLWVRETWTGTWHDDKMQIVYAATGDERFIEGNSPDYNLADYALPLAAQKPGNWVTPLFMPRWASRITLEITDVRVQRLQEVSEDDAWSEGVSDCMGPLDIDGRVLFKSLWDSINAKRGFGWDSNPWVWAITFKRIRDRS